MYGPGQAFVIHRGVIELVGMNHIEYMINTNGGCSGAIAFLLEQDDENYSKAIGVHAGKHNDLGDISIAFKFPAPGQGPPERCAFWKHQKRIDCSIPEKNSTLPHLPTSS